MASILNPTAGTHEYGKTTKLTERRQGFSSSRGTMSIRKSNWSNFVMAVAISFLCQK